VLLDDVLAQTAYLRSDSEGYRFRNLEARRGGTSLKIAIVSDIHGNLEALNAVCDSFDELWVLGDLVNYGPDPVAVVDFVQRNATVVVCGNHDHAIGAGVDSRCSPAFREMAQTMQTYTESVLSDEQKAYLRQLPLTAQREADGKRFFLCHAAPSDPLFKYSSAEAAFWTPELSGVNADVILVGHTHLPFILDLDTQHVVNPGSVGQPKHGRCEACYAVWEDGRMTLKSQPYDVDTTIGRLLDLPIDGGIRRQLADVLRNGVPPSCAR
jgi:putative phosphoesterase